MASTTIKAPTTIQNVATTFTGSVVNSAKLMTLNKLASQNLITGQKVFIPDTMLLPKWKEKLAGMKSSMSNKTLIVVGAAIAGFWYMNKKQQKSA